MVQLRSLEGFGAGAILVGVFLFWLALRDQMCTPGANVANHCGPNFIFLIPGVLLTLIGCGLLLLGYQHNRSTTSNADG